MRQSHLPVSSELGPGGQHTKIVDGPDYSALNLRKLLLVYYDLQGCYYMTFILELVIGEMKIVHTLGPPNAD